MFIFAGLLRLMAASAVVIVGFENIATADEDDDFLPDKPETDEPGTDESEEISGGRGSDQVNGYGGDDTVSSGAGEDHLYGEDGNDLWSGDDVLDGGTGATRSLVGLDRTV